MPRSRLVALLNGASLPDAPKIPGFVSSQRFRLPDAQREGAAPQWRYLMPYALDTDDVQGVIGEIKRRTGTPDMKSTDIIAPGGFLHFFQPIMAELYSAVAAR